jgi:hypothetical protein
MLENTGEYHLYKGQVFHSPSFWGATWEVVWVVVDFSLFSFLFILLWSILCYYSFKFPFQEINPIKLERKICIVNFVKLEFSIETKGIWHFRSSAFFCDHYRLKCWSLSFFPLFFYTWSAKRGQCKRTT